MDAEAPPWPRERTSPQLWNAPDFDAFCHLVCRGLRVSGASISLLEPSRDRLLGAHGLPAELGARRELEPGESLAHYSVERGLPFELADANVVPELSEHAAFRLFRARTLAACACTAASVHTVAILCVFDEKARAWDSADLDLLSAWGVALGDQLALCEARARMARELELGRDIVRHIPGAAVVLFDRKLRYRAAEGAELFEAVGLEPAELVGRSVLEVLPSDERERVERLYRATLEGRRGRLEMRRRNRWYSVHTLPLRDATGTVTFGMIAAYDVTELKQAQAELGEKTAILQTIVDNMTEGVIVSDTAGRPLLFNPAGASIVGFETSEGADPEQTLYLPDKRSPLPSDRAPMARALRGERIEQMEVYASSGESDRGRWFSINANPLLDASGVQCGGICVVRDVTVAKEADLALREQTAFVELLQKITLSANAALSSQEALRDCLSLVCAHMGWPIGHVYWFNSAQRELQPSDLWHLDDAALRRAFCEVTSRTRLRAGEGLPGRVLQTRKAEWLERIDDQPTDARAPSALEVGIRASVAFPVLVASEVVAVLEFFSDQASSPHNRLLAIMENVGVQLGRAVERERHVAAIEALSLTDELTGLCNRRGFMEQARRQVKILRRQRRSALLFFADLDGLKQINDSKGHEVGDAAIVEAAEVLRQSFRDTDVIARFGGDEFVVLVVEAEPGVSMRIAERIEANLRRRNALAGRTFDLAMSVGVSVYDPERPLSIEELLARADAAMYREKQQRKIAAAGHGASA